MEQAEQPYNFSEHLNDEGLTRFVSSLYSFAEPFRVISVFENDVSVAELGQLANKLRAQGDTTSVPTSGHTHLFGRLWNGVQKTFKKAASDIRQKISFKIDTKKEPRLQQILREKNYTLDEPRMQDVANALLEIGCLFDFAESVGVFRRPNREQSLQDRLEHITTISSIASQFASVNAAEFDNLRFIQRAIARVETANAILNEETPAEDIEKNGYRAGMEFFLKNGGSAYCAYLCDAAHILRAIITQQPGIHFEFLEEPERYYFIHEIKNGILYHSRSVPRPAPVYGEYAGNGEVDDILTPAMLVAGLHGYLAELEAHEFTPNAYLIREIKERLYGWGPDYENTDRELTFDATNDPEAELQMLHIFTSEALNATKIILGNERFSRFLPKAEGIAASRTLKAMNNALN